MDLPDDVPAPGASDPPCAAFHIRRAARHVSQAYDQVMAPSGLRVGQYALLRTLQRMGAGNVRAVARQLGLDRTTLGRNLRPLAREGWVAIAVSPCDRRGRSLTLTAEGEAKLAEAEPLWRAAQAMFETAYGAEQTAALLVLMRSVARLRLPN